MKNGRIEVEIRRSDERSWKREIGRDWKKCLIVICFNGVMMVLMMMMMVMILDGDDSYIFLLFIF